MEKLLLKYLKTTENWDTITIRYWNVDGANCFVEYFTDVNEYQIMEFKLLQQVKFTIMNL